MDNDKCPNVQLTVSFPQNASPSVQLIHALDAVMTSMTRDDRMEQYEIQAALLWLSAAWKKDVE